MKHSSIQRSSFFKNAAVLSLGGFLAKALGVLYRVPLAASLGGYGVGMYQMAYPLFCVLLTFSSTGVPAALARIVARECAEGRDSGRTLRSALATFSLLGLAGSAAMGALAPSMCALQGEPALLPCYLALAPSVFLVAVIAVLRGYFQGKNRMAPTAFSEIVEQVVKACAGLLLARRFSRDPVLAAACALGAVTLSELVALAYLCLRYLQEPRRRFLRTERGGADVLSSALPVMASQAILPLSQMADSVLLVRLLSRHTARAVPLYGLFAGSAVSLIGVPATVCYGLAAASVPVVSACFARGEYEEGRRRALRALLFTLGLSLPCAVGLFALAKPVVSLLYPALSNEDAGALVSLVRIGSVSAALLAGVDTLSACLTGMGRARDAARSMLLAVLVKAALQAALVPDPAFSIGGAAIAANVCYLVAFLLDLVYTVRKREVRENDHGRKPRNRARRSHAAGEEGAVGGGRSACAHRRDPRGADA